MPAKPQPNNLLPPKAPRETGIFYFFEQVLEVLGWLRIVLSPLLIGIIIAAFIYYSEPSTLRLVLALVVIALGLVIGIIWATRVWKKEGTMAFLSREIATPDLDHPEPEKKNDITQSR